MPSRAWVVVALLGAGVPFTAHADIYKCVDGSGHVTYSNIVQAGCQKLNLEPLSTIPPPPKPAVKPAAGARSGQPGFPRVDAGTQKKRDGDRRKILDDELATEERELEEARKALAEQEALRYGSERNYQRFLDRVAPYREAVARHERNIEALKRELANAR
ncbi:MAG TPA: DUF4124 domain-containing protein [Rhodocyclaceae bacterium]|nr:MAG: hypothetical protein AUK49_03420 [Betaproteobacteria bacterium CG2_30_68_42]PIV71857.1 MAG: DUF4124 domain-containing protein [Rhodocyclales bacterium CG17_big_fil_post_rev_8_21_14_2_50_68_7]PIX74831.1 MAG: DUF4124 domain-containing protein [Rhodocyclales bacterium CG_4_10_14_3_um_filter_68_10]PJA58818.1 MAG: DUF4124 domain-containing protein [Rhodocyclales bacterium CG_4_9_14_3_um_filter_68_10]HCX34900.1 DUF4124 domain-containing protein [Rhodocyclaceae bacterium]